MMLRTFSLTLSVLLALVVSTFGHPPPHFNSMAELCAHMESKKNADSDRKAMRECRDELMPKEKRENFENCKHDMKLDDDKAMKEYCKNPGEYESKFQEMKKCMQKVMEQNKPDPKLRAQFQECLEKKKAQSN